MKKFNKALVLLLLLLPLIFVFGCGKSDAADGSEAMDAAVNGDTPTIVVDQVKASQGEKSVKVSVSVKNNPGIIGMTLCVSYDETVLKMTNAENGEALSMLDFTAPGKLQSNYTFLWDGVDLPEDDIQDGTVLTMTFKVSADARAGKYPIIVSYSEGDIVNEDMDSVAFDVTNGAVTVS